MGNCWRDFAKLFSSLNFDGISLAFAKRSAKVLQFLRKSGMTDWSSSKVWKFAQTERIGVDTADDGPRQGYKTQNQKAITVILRLSAESQAPPGLHSLPQSWLRMSWTNKHKKLHPPSIDPIGDWRVLVRMFDSAMSEFRLVLGSQAGWRARWKLNGKSNVRENEN